MSRVDFFAVPDRAELGQELRQAFDELRLDDARATEPADADALLGVAFADGLQTTELEERAEELRTALAALLTGGPSVSYKLVTD